MNGAAVRATRGGRKPGRIAARWRNRRLQLRALQQRLGECRRELRQALARTAPDPLEVGELALEERLLLEQERLLAARRTSAGAHALRAERSPRPGEASAVA